jgi:hypothetical protein
MKNREAGNLWAASLILLGAANASFWLVRLLWAGTPNIVVRVLGIVMLIALAVFAFATAKLARKRN